MTTHRPGEGAQARGAGDPAHVAPSCSDLARSGSDHEFCGSDHESCGSDHELCGSDHAQRGSDLGWRGSDLTWSRSDLALDLLADALRALTHGSGRTLALERAEIELIFLQRREQAALLAEAALRTLDRAASRWLLVLRDRPLPAFADWRARVHHALALLAADREPASVDLVVCSQLGLEDQPGSAILRAAARELAPRPAARGFRLDVDLTILELASLAEAGRCGGARVRAVPARAGVPCPRVAEPEVGGLLSLLQAILGADEAALRSCDRERERDADARGGALCAAIALWTGEPARAHDELERLARAAAGAESHARAAPRAARGPVSAEDVLLGAAGLLRATRGPLPAESAALVGRLRAGSRSIALAPVLDALLHETAR